MSQDNGTTWSPLQVVYSESNATHAVTIGNPAPVVVGDKVLLFCRNNLQLLTLWSMDASATVWEESPADITAAVTSEVPTWIASGPPGGIVVDGRIIVALNFAQFVDIRTGGPMANAVALLSDDDGTTWSRSKNMVERGNEGQIALAPNGSLLFNLRTRAPHADARLLSWSDDIGTSWSQPAEFLPHSGSACEKSMIRASNDLLLFSHNYWYGGGNTRANLTLWTSADSGASWQWLEQADAPLRDEPAAYSSLLAHNETHAMLVYERNYRTLTWQLVALRAGRPRRPFGARQHSGII